MKNKIDHIGYLTGDIVATGKAFEKLGYQMGEIVNDDTQRTRICFLTKADEVRVELVEPRCLLNKVSLHIILVMRWIMWIASMNI